MSLHSANTNVLHRIRSCSLLPLFRFLSVFLRSADRIAGRKVIFQILIVIITVFALRIRGVVGVLIIGVPFEWLVIEGVIKEMETGMIRNVRLLAVTVTVTVRCGSR